MDPSSLTETWQERGANPWIAQRSAHLEEILAKAKPRHEPEVEEASLKEARLAIPTPMLDVIFRDGRIRSFSYAYLAEVEFEPGDTLTLKFTSGAEIIAEGRGLSHHRQQVAPSRRRNTRMLGERTGSGARRGFADRKHSHHGRGQGMTPAITEQMIKALSDTELAQVDGLIRTEQEERAERYKRQTLATIKELAKSIEVGVKIGEKRGRPRRV